MRIKNGIIFTLTLQLLAPPIWGAESTKPLRAVYFSSCDQLLNSFEPGDFERQALQHVTSPEQLRQMMLDYGLLYTEPFRAGVLLSLDEEFPEFALEKGIRALELKEVEKIHALAAGPRDRVVQFGYRVIDHISQIVAVPYEREEKADAQVRHLAINGFINALRKNSDKKELFEDILYASILASLYTITNHHTGKPQAPELHRNVAKSFIFLAPVTAYLVSSFLIPQIVDTESRLLAATFSYIVASAFAFGGYASLRTHQLLDRRAKVLAPARAHPDDSILVDKAYYEGWAPRYVWMQPSIGLGLDQVNTNKLTELTELTPPQIAYLGHRDQLRLTEKINDMHKNLPQLPTEQLQQIIAIGRKALTDPESIDSKMEFSSRLVSAHQLLSKMIQSYSEVESELTTSIAALKRSVVNIKGLAMNSIPSAEQTDLLSKQKLLIIRLQTSLNKFSDLEIDMSPITNLAQELTVSRDKLIKLTKTMPDSDEKWEQMIMDGLEALEKATAAMNNVRLPEI